MKNLAKVVMVIGFGLLVGCNGTKEINIYKEGKNNMKIETLDELLKSQELILAEGKTKYQASTRYLVDGTKVEFQRCINKNSRYMVERIYSSKYPFVEFAKGYNCQTEKLTMETKSIKDVSLGTTKVYNERGEVTKTINYGERLGYKNILKWAEQQGFIDLRIAEVLEGKDFELWYEEFKPNSYEENYKKYIEKYKNRELVVEMLKHKAFWTYTIYYEYEFRKFILSDDGVLIYDEGKKRIPASGTEI